MPRRTRRASPTRVTLLLLFLAATVAVAALLAYEAHTASRAERRTVERALSDYVATAAWEFQSALRKSLEAEVPRAFGVITAGSAQTPRDPLVPVAALRASAEGAFRCGDASGAGTVDTGRHYARLDLSTGVVVADPPSAVAGDRRRLEDALRTVAASLPPVDRPFAMVWGGEGGGEGGVRSNVVVVAVRYARLDVPVALYAFSACASALRQRLPGLVARTHRLLPDAVAGGLPSDSLLSLTLRDATGAVLMQVGETVSGDELTATRDGAALRTEVSLADLGGATLSVALQPAAMRQLLLVPAERGRVPLLIGLLALTAILAALSLVQVRREHELAQLRADFTSSVSHELRTPLAQILLFGETLSLERARSPEERRFAADTIVGEARRLMQLVDNILLFAQLRRGEPRVQLSEMSLAAVVADVAAGFVPLAEARGSRLQLDLRDETLVRGDREALRQVVLNLLDNATKYGSHGQSVRVAVTSSPAGVSLVVEDEGGGILPSDRERVWLPYVRLTRGGASPGGSGLGLAVVRELTRAMGASARVGEAPGGGASFVIDFIAAPLAPSEGVALVAPSYAVRLPGQ